MSDSKSPNSPFSSVAEVIDDLRQGKMAVILDDEDRENEGDLVCAAEFATSETINFMATHGRGLICMPMTLERLEALQIPLMVEQNTARRGTAFCVSIEARKEITTGISAADRAKTIAIAVDPSSRPSDLASPGHVFPLRSTPGGVLRRTGHTEASVDLCRLAGLTPAAVICEIMNPDGTMARLEQLKEFSARHGLKMMSIAQLVSHRMRTERLVTRVASPELDTVMGRCKVHAFRHELDNETLVALVKGEPDPEKPTLVRVHTGCWFSDLFGPREDSELYSAMQRIAEEETGVVLYLPGRGPGIREQLLASEKADSSPIGPVADHRNFGLGAQVLFDLGIRRLRLLTNSEGKYVALQGYGLELVDRVPLHSQVGDRVR